MPVGIKKSHVYIFVRRDLPPAQIAVQACHAAYEAASLRNSELDHPHFVVLGIKDLKNLESALSRVKNAGFQIQSFYESDLNNQLTSFATGHIFEKDRGFFRRYNCLNSSMFCQSDNF